MNGYIKSFTLMVLLILIFAYNYPLQSQPGRETLAVLDFNVSSGLSTKEATTLTNVFRSTLFNTQIYDVLERNEMESILKEQVFTLSGACNSAECAVEIGKLLSAEKMVIGDIGKIGEYYSITVRLVSVSTSKIDISFDERYKGDPEGLLDVFKEMASKLAGTYDEGSNIWWYIGGAAVVGAGVAVVLLKAKEEGEEPLNGVVVGAPPSNPLIT